MRQLIVGAMCASLLAGCATAPDKVSANYVSPMQYGSYDCDQIREELIRISNQVGQVSGQQRRAHTRDAVAVTVGVLVFWPALFVLMAGDKKEELANLKGQYDALDEAAIQKRCPVADELRGAPPRPQTPAPAAYQPQSQPQSPAPAPAPAAYQAPPPAPAPKRACGITSPTNPSAVSC